MYATHHSRNHNINFHYWDCPDGVLGLFGFSNTRSVWFQFDTIKNRAINRRGETLFPLLVAEVARRCVSGVGSLVVKS
ncbi:MAG: hypothetical protein UT24_C0034G0016 [Candidatus Woesebacteria bacterium GW2011_GWB1_39_12]|uniref:Uncharacterized protein n=1 Tax=Candidatus Woesebacteria bacterium GW2011_GWB1_39_12 TaxID=1618574 RepID=A0A0G0M3U3_9BACT|nr:MAG: hypothetical protein UT24_C0034G0016 [Candidatus Woesebacteria bacterium GW2011_GWB1_39_12]